MSTRLTHVASGDSVDLAQVLGFASTTNVPTVVHAIIGQAAPEFTLQPAGPRTGTLHFLAWDEVYGAQVGNLLRRLGPFAITLADALMADLTFMVTGDITWTLDDQTRTRIVIDVDFTEVLL